MFKGTDKQKEIYKYFLEQYGIKQQQSQVVEECTELNTEILKMNRYYNNIITLEEHKIKAIKEIGDVLNAIDSFLYIYDIDINEIHTNRLNKLEKYYEEIQ